MGQIFTEAGYEVVFVDVVPAVLAALNERRAYTLRLAGPDRFETLMVSPVRAVDGRDLAAVARELARCAFACTAVGVPVLPHLVPALAAGINEREGPLDVILCENQLNCSDLLRGLLGKSVSEERLRTVGLVESVVSRMVPVLSDEVRGGDPLLVVAEDYAVLPVDSTGFVGAIPAISAIRAVDHFSAYVERKLYVHNLGHAIAAYLGYQRGHQYIHEAMGDGAVREVVEGAMRESGEALVRKHGFTREEIAAHRADLIRRFENPALGDTVLRVGRDPVRKLRPDDRLIGAAMTCLDWDVEPEHIIQGIVAALRFDPPDDPGAASIQQSLRDEGLGEVLLRLTGRGPDSEVGRRVLDRWEAS
ncbi:MAG: mannitol dehydrogenase [Armatimonadetes bacterium]|nr:mannitol dehydrogenase [Armatimonadota bacterium]